MFITNNHALFHLWWKDILIKHQNVSKYYEHNYRKLCVHCIYESVPEVPAVDPRGNNSFFNQRMLYLVSVILVLLKKFLKISLGCCCLHNFIY